MAWLRAHPLRAALHLCAAAIMAFVVTQDDPDMGATESFDPMLESGKWALRMLLLCLAMTPLATYLGWKEAAQLRKPLGLWAFGFALAHVLLSLGGGPGLARWLEPVPLYMPLGALSLLILTALAVTSNRGAMRRLGRAWKRLHRLVYLAGGSVAVHALLAAAGSKRMLARDPREVHELQLAAALLAVLLIVRIPAVRRVLQPVLAPLRRQRARPQPVAAPIVPPAPAPGSPAPHPAAAPSLPDMVWLHSPALEVEEEEALVEA